MIHRRIAALSVLWMTLCAHGAAVEIAAWAEAESERHSPPAAAPAVGASDRIVHRFDFNERPEGNLEDVPKYWEPFRPPGFPRFAIGSFDSAVGRLAPPSFHLSSSGRDVAYQYAGPDARVRADTEYRIEGYIRPDRLARARVCLSAHFVDEYGQPLLGTMVRTRYIGGPDESAEWVGVELYLASAPANATSVGLIAWVLQESTWNTGAMLRRHISPVDVHGGAWFDDITIYRLPRVELGTGTPGNVLAADDPRALKIVLADADGGGLSARLSISDADGEPVADHVLSSSAEDRGRSIRVPVGMLKPGLYHARLDVGGGVNVVVSRTLSFMLLPPMLRSIAEGLSRPFGVVIDPRLRTDRESEFELLARHSVRSVKLPIWTGLDEESADPRSQISNLKSRRATARFLQDLVKNRFLLTGVLWGPPIRDLKSQISNHGAYQQPLIDLLAGDRSDWESALAAEVAPTASMIRWWQIGPDGESAFDHADLFGAAVSQMREALRTYITVPRIGAPASASDDLVEAKLPVEQVTLSIPAGVDPNALSDQIRSLKAAGYEHVSAYVAPLPADQYGRLPRLGEWARRLIGARHAGADVVYAPQLWRSRATSQGMVTEPMEEYLILRTVGELLSDATPGPSVRIADGVHCEAFELPDSVVLAIWDDGSPPEGRDFAMQLGQASRQVDLWGQSTPLSRDDAGRQVVRLSDLPIFVDGVEPWLIDLMTSIAIDPPRVESGTELMRQSLAIGYRGSQPVSGQGMLVPPDGVELSPRTFAFTARPNQPQRIPFEVRYAHNAPAGRKDFVARITLMQPPYYLEVPLSVDLGLSDVEVTGTAVVERGDLILRHVIHNHSSNVLSFRSTAAAPGRERQYRPITNLVPGDTQTVVYRFHNGTELIGRRVYLALRELNDGPRQHNLELVVP
jgi:hypothetical protein